MDFTPWLVYIKNSVAAVFSLLQQAGHMEIYVVLIKTNSKVKNNFTRSSSDN